MAEKDTKVTEKDTKVDEVHTEQVVNTTGSLKSPKTNADLANETKAAQKKFAGEKTVKVSIPSVLVPKLGNVQFISINGVSVNVPVDGEDHEIPKPHADFLKQYLKELK